MLHHASTCMIPPIQRVCVRLVSSSLNGTFNCNLSICPTIWLPFITCTNQLLLSFHLFFFVVHHSTFNSIDSDSVHWDEEIFYWFPFHFYAREWRFHQNMKGTNHSRIAAQPWLPLSSRLFCLLSLMPSHPISISCHSPLHEFVISFQFDSDSIVWFVYDLNFI